MYLLEATAKKTAFLEATVRTLLLEDTYVLAGRAETLAHDGALRESFDLVVARAVAQLPGLIELALPFLKIGGLVAAMKGSRAGEEISSAQAALDACGGELIEEIPILPSSSLGLVTIRKVSSTPDRFPRRPGRPAAHPLKSQ
jgi:16S rRNA (guanine527-N7)-methyltransferase